MLCNAMTLLHLERFMISNCIFVIKVSVEIDLN